MKVINFLPDGRVETLGEPDIAVAVVRRTRVSHIVPLNWFKRIAFHAIRLVCGERGRAAEWTRRWRGPWMCRIIGSRRRFYNVSRQACLRWEEKVINQMRVNEQ